MKVRHGVETVRDDLEMHLRVTKAWHGGGDDRNCTEMASASDSMGCERREFAHSWWAPWEVR